jgi:pimeloyl-ACP methyl ester carboxylesterase
MLELILVPGLLCDDQLWSAQTQGLADLARSHVPEISAELSICAMADAVLRDAPQTFALAGFSMGGCVALEMVARAPSRVQRLALLSTSASGVLPQVREHYQATIAELEAGGLEQYLADAFPKYVAPVNVRDASVWQTFLAMGRVLGAAVAARQMRALLEYPGFQGGLQDIACPTMLICGEEDQRTPVAVHREMATQIRGAELCVIRDSGHFTPLERPAAVTAALRRWLGRP